MACVCAVPTMRYLKYAKISAKAGLCKACNALIRGIFYFMYTKTGDAPACSLNEGPCRRSEEKYDARLHYTCK